MARLSVPVDCSWQSFEVPTHHLFSDTTRPTKENWFKISFRITITRIYQTRRVVCSHFRLHRGSRCSHRTWIHPAWRPQQDGSAGSLPGSWALWGPELRQGLSPWTLRHGTQESSSEGKQVGLYGSGPKPINTLRPRQNGRHFADDIFKCIFLNENVWISSKISLKFVPKGPVNNIPALVQIMAWRRPGDKPLSEAMMVNLPTHICVSRPQWVKMHFFCV